MRASTPVFGNGWLADLDDSAMIAGALFHRPKNNRCESGRREPNGHRHEERHGKAAHDILCAHIAARVPQRIAAGSTPPKCDDAEGDEAEPLEGERGRMWDAVALVKRCEKGQEPDWRYENVSERGLRPARMCGRHDVRVDPDALGLFHPADLEDCRLPVLPPHF